MDSTNITQALNSYLSAKMLLPIVQNILLAIAIFVAGWFVSKSFSRVALKTMRKRGVDEALSRFLSQILLYTVLAATVIASLGAVGVETTSLVAVFASAGLAVGLALQGSLANFASGVMLLFFRPFALGDVIKAGGHTGKVDDLGIFATTLMTPDNEKIIIPNAKITADSIVNLTTIGIRRGCVSVGVAYGSDVTKVQDVLLRAAKEVGLVLDDPAPSVVFMGLDASALTFNIYSFAKAATGGPCCTTCAGPPMSTSTRQVLKFRSTRLLFTRRGTPLSRSIRMAACSAVIVLPILVLVGFGNGENVCNEAAWTLAQEGPSEQQAEQHHHDPTPRRHGVVVKHADRKDIDTRSQIVHKIAKGNRQGGYQYSERCRD